MLASIELFMKLSEWAQANAKPILAGTTVLFVALWGRSCVQSNALSLELEACKAKPPVIQTVTAKALQTVKVVYRDGSPCADVEATNDSSVSVTQTASTTPQNGPRTPSNGLWVGGGYIGRPYVSAGLQIGALEVHGQVTPLLDYGGGVSWRAFAW